MKMCILYKEIEAETKWKAIKIRQETRKSVIKNSEKLEGTVGDDET